MRRSLRALAWTLGILLGVPVLLGALVLFMANIQPGRDLIERMVPKVTGDNVRLQGLAGRFPTALRAARIEVRDPKGAWLIIENLTLSWTPSRLLVGEALIDRLAATRIELARLPVSSSEASETSAVRLPLRVALQSLDVARLDIAAAVAGTEEAFSIEGHARLASLEQGDLLLDIQGLNGAGSYRVEGSFDPTTLAGQLKAEESANGPAARLAGLEDVGAIALDASLKGPRSAVAVNLSLAAGPLSANARGTLDLLDSAADLRVTAAASAMSPRPDLAWQSVSLDATLSGPFARPTAAGTLRIADLRTGGAEVRTIAADVQGDAGQVQLQASLDGLRIPGQSPEALAAAPVTMQADARLDMPERPVTFRLEHPLIRAKGEAQTTGERKASISLNLPDLAAFAAMAGADVQGHSELELRAAEKAGETVLDAEGTVSITGGAPPLPGLLGDSAKISASVGLDGQDLTLSRLQIDGKTIDLSANGGLISQAVKLTWRAALSDLAVLTPTISGTLQANGQLQGSPDDFSAQADLSGELETKGLPRAPISAHLEAKGLPKTPTGEITARGTLAGSALEFAVVALQSGEGTTRVDIKRADWKSAHAEGQLTLAPGALLPVGTLDLRMPRLQDLAPLIGQSPTGSLTATLKTTQQGGETEAELAVDASAAGLSGIGSVDHLTLAATVFNPTADPVVDAKLVVDGLSANGVAGSGRLEVEGPQNALALQVAADAKNLAGSPLRLTGEALLDATVKNLSLSALQASWKGETLRLLSPAQFAFAEGVGVEDLRVGIQEAVFEVSGRVSPVLDLTAEVRNLSPALAAAFVPDLQAEGKLRADAKLAGTLARPTGTVRVDATGLRMRAGPAGSLPAANLTAMAELAGESARIDSRLTLGPKTNLTVTGQAPISSTGRLDLRARGSVDLALADPILGASGRRVRGQIQLDAGLTGTLASPHLGGTAQLAGGEVQDYAQGAHITGINALLQLEGEGIRIARLTARAGPGTISAAGTVGILARDMPIDLRLEARDARPLSSDLLTVSLDANLTATGQLAKQLLLSGDIRIDKAELRIPQTLPTNVATLNVRRRGEKPPPPPAPGPIVKLDLTIEAPGQMFVRGRGLDAELGGSVRVQGTADKPQPIGSFELRRGQFSLAGQTLNFAKGKVSFMGGSLTDPSLDFTVIPTNATVDAKLNIGGTVSNPKITLSSIPELPQDEILAQILFGRSASSLSPFELAQIASALAQLTGVTSGGLDPLNSIREGLGLDQLSVGTSASGQVTLEAGRYVTPGVYVGVEQGASVDSTKAKVQVDLTKRLKLEGTVGTSSGSATGSSASAERSTSIGVTYELEY
jgi:translocation and assembly module TamB